MSKKSTIFGFPIPTFIVIAILAIIAAIIVSFKTIAFLSFSPAPKLSLPTNIPFKIDKPVLPPQAINPINLSSANMIFNVTYQIPDKVSVYQASPSGDLDKIANLLVKKFHLSKINSPNRLSSWENQNYFLSVPENKPLTFTSTKLPLLIPKTYDLTPDSASTLSATILKNLDIDLSKYSFDPGTIILIDSDNIIHKFDSTLIQNGNINKISLSYNYVIGDYSTTIDNRKPSLQMEIDGSKSLYRLVISPVPSTYQKLFEAPPFAPTALTDIIKNNPQFLVGVDIENYNQIIAVTSMRSITIDKFDLVNYYSPTQNLIYPAFLLSGQGTYTNNIKVNITFLVPAIDPSYFK